MKAMIFAAGLGTRLRPLTNDRPKALVEVGGKPMLEHVINHLAQAGFDDITINIHHFGQKIIDFLESKNNFGLNIHISDERDLLLDTGGGILKARPFLDGDEPFLVHNADILTDLDLKAMVATHKQNDAVATLLVKSRLTQRYFVFDNDYRLNGWINKKTGETKPATLSYAEGEMKELAFGGVHVISPKIFPLLEKHAQGEEVFSITPFYIEQCNACHIHGYECPTPYNWLDVGKPETLEEANRLFGK
ncbi:MAG: nucleotidyltransferase family protein [Muribaculaceae bacterium]|nr:nucleotidyltransferase family protein [Muribaculaceae bacterium]